MLLAGLTLGGYAGYLQLTGNFHTVVAGQFYRSAQPSPAQLERYIRDHGIKTVINLRGNAGYAKWWAEEVAVSERLGVKHVDFGMSASKILSTEKADQLVAIMRDAPKPILVHCLSGSDRTGLASVLYSAQVANIKEDVAERQLSFVFGHVGIPKLSAAYAMDETWSNLEKHYGLDKDQGEATVHDALVENDVTTDGAG
ncbi:tyrosine-protein phosphatase [Rhizobium sp. 2MFCol3.1]|uniref:tyrosine-protein phosphatase n=1 Tax=Rhizobium sp. 2MFCol3.1 TaxID=1246459 RepID=UPI0009D91896|nr:tyrosine-protein phosphatase [Rhizobium sp. 2MFCol3.1]